jgi:hypothetical protein
LSTARPYSSVEERHGRQYRIFVAENPGRVLYNMPLSRTIAPIDGMAAGERGAPAETRGPAGRLFAKAPYCFAPNRTFSYTLMCSTMHLRRKG